MRKKTILLLLLILSFISVFFSVNQSFAQIREDPKKTDAKFSSALSVIKNFYVDTVNPEDLTEKAIIEMLKELDPHSVYFTKEEIEKANEPLVGNFDGIGVQFQIFKDTILIVDAIRGGPSEKLGIIAGDRIIRIDNEDATGKKLTNNYVISKLRGTKGTKVTVSIKRKGKPALIDYTITRDKIPINSIDASYMVSGTTGYIKLDRFSRNTMLEFAESVTKLKRMGMASLILDLRGNSGGYLDVAISLADEFLEAGKLIVYTEGMNSPVQKFHSTAKGDFETGKLAILIDEGSASASEIVSGAVQDWDRGIIVGRRSFGKGLVQRPYNLSDGSVIRLTTARYHTPTGRCIQKPYEEGVDKYYEDFSRRMKKGEFIHPDSIKFPDSLKYYTPSKRIVYGGGGIMPDVFFPLDTTAVSDYYLELRRKRIINDFVMLFIDNNRDSLKSEYINFSHFNAKFMADSSFYSSFVKYAESQGVVQKETEKNKDKDEKSEKFLKCQLKALLSSNLYGQDKYYVVIMDIDNELQKAIDILNDDKLFKKLKISY